jgi:hypothetical protein
MSTVNQSAGSAVAASSTCAAPDTGKTATKRRVRAFPVDAMFFTCPAEHYGAGKLSGVRAAAELLRRVTGPEKTDSNHWRMLEVRNTMSEAGCAMQIDDGKSSSHAAYEFMGIMAELIVFAAKHPDIERFLQQRQAAVEREVAGIERIERRRREAFSQRMKAGKQAKRLQRATPGVSA